MKRKASSSATEKKKAPGAGKKTAAPGRKKSPAAGRTSSSPAAAEKTKKTPPAAGKKTAGRSKASSSLPETGTGKALVIVESPTKAKTLTKILGPKYVVKSSVGHIRDLPKSRLAIDVENDFAPEYILVKGKAKVKNELTGLAQKASRVILASDPDREGEAIAWHLCELLDIDPASPCRVRFYEITPGAVREAVKNPEEVNMSKVEAQQARRILDRLVGYTLSPLLWKKIRRGLSAGRVQSVALALICAREREIREFVPRAYWLVTVAAAAGDGRKYTLRADSLDGKSLWKEGKSLLIDSEQVVEAILGEVEKFPLTVTDFKVRESLRAAPAPFKTSTLQQEAARRSGLSPRRTMSIAQELFEGVSIPGRGPTGLITYMRTDSLRIAPEAVEKCRAYIASSFEPSYLPEKENAYSAKGRSQDAHEAIRPTDVTITPESLEGILTPDQMKLYSLIWRRYVASQMTPARVANATLTASAGRAGFRQLGETLLFSGWSAVWPLDLKGESLQPAAGGEVLSVEGTDREQKFTRPPARYSEATLIKVLEDEGVGRPSTYASIVETLYDRGYVVRNEERRLQSTPLGETVDEFLMKYFNGESLSSIVDTGFTARMEESLDDVEEGKVPWLAVLRDFWKNFTVTMAEAETAPAAQLPPPEPIGEDCPECGKPLVLKNGRFGEFIGCSGYPECRFTRPVLVKTGAVCPKCGTGDVVKRKSRKGKPFYGCSRYPECDFVSWNPPSGRECPECGAAMMTTGRKGGEECPKCGYVPPKETRDDD
ncbi:MAG TPA: type I DNA topoisomerase [Aminivibrio sp.]|uniref:type I DNA topoisomerase n=1 Tax=Aminivibrio sp. TaxID=1872489 RepID=UPI002C88C7EE|nr:type I DNA topoisomerase [Aminivibrio sp.]HPF83790.1 type I DNA topoisomerase [Aminivibrio sp.]